jgi:hypothetical protein
MAYGIGASGIVGVAFETTSGVYTAPTKFVPILSETLEFKETNNFRRPIRQSAAQIGVVAGDFDVEGTITMEATEDTCIYFTECARMVGVKTGSTPNFVYTYTPTSVAVPPKTMSITVVRNGVVFGYTGCGVTKQTFTVNNNLLEFSADIIGLNEATQTAPGVVTWPVRVPGTSRSRTRRRCSTSTRSRSRPTIPVRPTSVSRTPGARSSSATASAPCR